MDGTSHIFLAAALPATRENAMSSSSPDPHDAADAPVTAETGDDEITCGELLRRARQGRGLTLQRIAQITKIPLRHLDALERDEFAALPGGMYRRAHVRAYADAVGLDRSVALAWLDRALEEAAPRTASVARASEPSPVSASGRTRVMISGGLAIIATVIVLAIRVSQPTGGHVGPSAAAVSPAASSVVPAPQPTSYVLVASSRGTVAPASASPGRRIEPDT